MAESDEEGGEADVDDDLDDLIDDDDNDDNDDLAVPVYNLRPPRMYQANPAPAELQPLTAPMCSDYTHEDLLNAQVRFINRLTRISLSNLRPSTAPASHTLPGNPYVDEEEARSIADFLFYQLLQAPARTRVSSLVNYHQDEIVREVNRARNASRNADLPRLARDVFAAWADSVTIDTKSNTASQVLFAHVAKVQLYRRYHDLVHAAQQDTGGIREELFKRGITANGKGYATLVRLMLADILGLPPKTKKVGSTIQQCGYLVHFVDRLGPGILVLMPKNFIQT